MVLILSASSIRHAAVLLFLNKKDLFAEKVRRVPLRKAFPDYTGTSWADADGGVAAAMSHVASLFRAEASKYVQTRSNKVFPIFASFESFETHMHKKLPLVP